MGKPFTMSQQEISRLEIIQRLLDRRLSQAQAADILHITTRQIQRLVRAYRQQGVSGIISRRRGKPSNHMIPQTIRSPGSEQ